MDAGTGALPPLRGESDSKYLTSNLTFDPNTRLSLSLAANVEEQQASTATPTSRLATTTVRFEPRPGLSVSGSGV